MASIFTVGINEREESAVIPGLNAIYRKQDY
jgi:hypothetical protein